MEAAARGSVAQGGVVPLQLLLPVHVLLVPVLPLLLLAAFGLGAGDVILLLPVLALLFLFLLLLQRWYPRGPLEEGFLLGGRQFLPGSKEPNSAENNCLDTCTEACLTSLRLRDSG